VTELYVLQLISLTPCTVSKWQFHQLKILSESASRWPFLSFKLVQAGNPSKPDVSVYLKPVKKQLLVLEVIANSMQQNPSWETVSSQLVEECPTYHGNRRFNTMFKKTCNSLYSEPDQGTPWCPISLPIVSVKFITIQPHHKPKMHIINGDYLFN